jgi:hypothetical protein
MAELDYLGYGSPLGGLLRLRLKVVKSWIVGRKLMPGSDPHVKLVRAGFLRQVS